MSGMESLRARRAEILEIARRHGVTDLRIFGSVARGEAGPNSDIDILVEVGPDCSAWFPGGLIADLQQLLGRPVQVVTQRGLNLLIKDHVMAEAVPL